MLGYDPQPPPVTEPRFVRLQLPLQSRPWLAMALVALNVVIFVVMSLMSRRPFVESLLGGADTLTLIRFGAKANDLIRSGEVWRLLTPVFLHIGVIHLLFNQYALAQFGQELERIVGTARFAVIYLLSGLAGTLLSFALAPYVAAGASGAIFGLIGAMTLFFWRNRALLGEVATKQARSLVGLILINLLLLGQLGNIDNWGHIGGLIAGVLAGLFLVPVYRPGQRTDDTMMLVADRSPRTTVAVLVVGLVLIALGLVVALPIAP